MTRDTSRWCDKTNLIICRSIYKKSIQYGAACETYHDSAYRTLPFRRGVAAVTAEGLSLILLLLSGVNY